MRDPKANLDMKWYEVGEGTDPHEWETDTVEVMPESRDEEVDVFEMIEFNRRDKSRLTD